MYINGLGAISPQLTFPGDFPHQTSDCQSPVFACQEPDYQNFIAPRISRRMSRVVKMGVSAALMALKNAGLEKPEAIVTGSGYGCMSDTESFLSAISINDEKYLNPAAFIHSTHNTIGSQLALLLNCTGYNQTYVHGPLSFESALLDSLLLHQEHSSGSVLVGGVDEMTQNLERITRRLGLWKSKPITSGKLLNSGNKGSVAGEGAVYLLLSGEADQRSYAKLLDSGLWTHCENDNLVMEKVKGFLADNNLTPDDLDLYFLGKNGDYRFDRCYQVLEEMLIAQKTTAYFKHLCGEYPTASAFACWQAAHAIKHQFLPEYLQAKNHGPSAIRTVLIINRYRGDHLGLILLQSCGE